MPTPPRRRWFQFSLRTLFVVVALVAVWVESATIPVNRIADGLLARSLCLSDGCVLIIDDPSFAEIAVRGLIGTGMIAGIWWVSRFAIRTIGRPTQS